jgi:hypothetical protein
MVGNIMLYFSTLASAFRLKAPLPPYLPPAEKARQQLVSSPRTFYSFFFLLFLTELSNIRWRPSENWTSCGIAISRDRGSFCTSRMR